MPSFHSYLREDITLTQQHIYHLNELGQLEPMQEEPFALEDKLQELVAEYPGLLSGEQMNPDNPRRFILIGREQGIADIIGGGHRWSLDHLLIDQDAVPTLVEAKRQGNSEIRREIVGQMMDYAAHATQTWNVGDIRQAFEERVSAAGQDSDSVLSELLRSEGETDSDAFWQRVDDNLRAARLRLLFVADGIPDELARVVEFLNEQMPRIEVLAVEIKQFRGEAGSSTLVPRVIGRTAEAVAAPSRGSGSRHTVNLNQQTLLESFPDEQIREREAVGRLLEVARKHRAGFNWSTGGVSIRAASPAFKNHLSVAWLYAPGAEGFMSVGGVVFGAGNGLGSINGLERFFENIPQNVGGVLDNWVNAFSNDEFVTLVERNGIKAWHISHADAADAANIDLLAARLDRVLGELRDLPPSS